MLKHIMTATLWSTLIALVVCYCTSTHAFVVPLKCSLSLPTPISNNRRALSSSTTNTRNLLPSRGFVSALFSGKQNSQEKEASSETSSSPSSKAEDCGCDEQKPGLPPPLTPFMEALDPKYKCTGPVGQGSFVVSRTGGPTKEELSNENLYKILMIECSDLEVNTVVWKCLGYRFDEEKQEWTAAEVFPNWKEKYPTPPDLIGMARIYSKEVDQPSLKANQSLVRSVPVDNKQSLKTHLKPLGFTGYKYAELTPNKTRRAQCANWLLYYREELFGYTLEELKERRRLKKEAAEEEKRRLEKETGKSVQDEWKPPVKEVF